MGIHESRKLTEPARSCSRREFLHRAASSAALISTVPAMLGSDSSPRGESTVIQVNSRQVVSGGSVHQTLLRDMLTAAMTALTNTADLDAAWRSILVADDVVGLKFNRSGQDAIGTTNAFGGVIVESLLKTGWNPHQIVCIEAPAGFSARYGTMEPIEGFDSLAVDFGSGTDQLALVLKQVTALISVPFVKTHNIAGMTGAMKNLSHALVKHPARFHGHGCSPYVADILALPEIRRKLRLCLVDALRVVVQGGPAPRQSGIVDNGTLLASFDPVAVDAAGVLLLNEARRQNGLETLVARPTNIAYLGIAEEKGIGVATPGRFPLIRFGS